MSWQREDGSEDGLNCSSIACQSCRKRKVKCDRELPQCRICQQASSTCIYPPGPRKPGPKIGTTQRSGRAKRRRLDEPTASENDQSQMSSAEGALGGAIGSPGLGFSPASNEQNVDTAQLSVVPTTVYGVDLQTLPQRNLAHEDVAEPDQDQANRSAHSLAFILHPSHEACTLEEEPVLGGIEEAGCPEEPLSMSKTCYALGITSKELKRLLDVYFKNMTSFSLFHEPTFYQKLRHIPSFPQLNALLASMLSFAVQLSAPDITGWQRKNDPPRDHRLHFAKLAAKFTQEAIDECGDDVPTLSLLQALIISTHGGLVRGVKGKAWRALGLCVRMAYEMNLHLIDSARVEAGIQNKGLNWCQEEERRRAWWAIWEMDVFASTVRRCPTAINWSQNETCLPASDEDWHHNLPRPGCFLQGSMMKRWRVLESSKNRSAKAWFIVVNSLMREAQLISSPKGIFGSAFPRNPSDSYDCPRMGNYSTQDASDALSALADALRCFCLALPQELQFRGQNLSFESRTTKQSRSERHAHSGIASIHIMTQLAWLMIHHYHVFELPGILLPRKHAGEMNSFDRIVLDQYFGASDLIVDLIRASSEHHFKYLNPFLASTVWMAAAVQLVHREFRQPEANSGLTQGKFDLLCTTYMQMVEMWGIATAMQQNLDLIANRLQRYKSKLNLGQRIRNSYASPSTAQGEQMNSDKTTAPLASRMANHATHCCQGIDHEHITNPFPLSSDYSLADGLSNGGPELFYPITPISTMNSIVDRRDSENCTMLSTHGHAPLMDDMMPGFDFDVQSGDYNDAELSNYLNDLLSGPRLGVY